MRSLGKISFYFICTMLLIAFFCNQTAFAGLYRQDAIDKSEVEEWVVRFHESLFVQMNPKKTFDDFVFVGKLTNIEAKTTEREWLNSPQKKVSKELRARYARLNFERRFYEIYFLFGTRKLSANFIDINYDDDGFTTIENLAFVELLNFELKKSNIYKESYINFFKQDKKLVTREQLLVIERFFENFTKLIQSKINLSMYQENIANLKKLWKVESENDYKKYFLITNEFGSLFIVGKKNGRIKILDFPEFIN